MSTTRDGSGRVRCECCQATAAEMALALVHAPDEATAVVLCGGCFTALRPALDASGLHYAGKSFDEAAEDGIVPLPLSPDAFARQYFGR